MTSVRRSPRYAEERGWDWTLFEDPGISGQTLADRPGAVASSTRWRAARSSACCWHITTGSTGATWRWPRCFIDLGNAGARIATPGGMELDLGNDNDNLMAWMSGIFAVHDQKKRTARMKSALRRTVENGFWPGGPAPYGYRLAPDPAGSKHKVLVINDNEADVLRRVASFITAGTHTTYSAATLLNAEGVRTRRGSLWRHPNLCHQLRQIHLTGTWTYKQGGDPITMQIPAMFTLAEWQDMSSGPSEGKPRPQRREPCLPPDRERSSAPSLLLRSQLQRTQGHREELSPIPVLSERRRHTVRIAALIRPTGCPVPPWRTLSSRN
jgi:hypothetical protein